MRNQVLLTMEFLEAFRRTGISPVAQRSDQARWQLPHPKSFGSERGLSRASTRFLFCIQQQSNRQGIRELGVLENATTRRSALDSLGMCAYRYLMPRISTAFI